MGEVYKAHDSSLRRVVAIKILPPSAADNPGSSTPCRSPMPSTRRTGAKGLGKHEVCGSRLYINRLSDVDEKVLEQMIRASWRVAGEKYGR